MYIKLKMLRCLYLSLIKLMNKLKLQKILKYRGGINVTLIYFGNTFSIPKVLRMLMIQGL
jgi:hypothetical protein